MPTRVHRNADAAVAPAGYPYVHRVVFGLMTVAAAVMIGLQLLTESRGYSMMMLTADTSRALGGPFWIGWVSYAGILLWWTAAAVALSSHLVLRGRDEENLPPFLLSSGLLTALLTIDDLFMLHDGLFPWLGVPENAVLAGLVILTAVWLWTFRRTIRTTNVPLLAAALGFFAVSVAYDLYLLPAPRQRQYLMEDDAKLLSIIAWCAYLTSTALGHLQLRLAESGPSTR